MRPCWRLALLRRKPRKPSLMSVLTSDLYPLLYLSDTFSFLAFYLWSPLLFFTGLPFVGTLTEFRASLMLARLSTGRTDGRGAEEGTGQLQHAGENKEEHGVHSERFRAALA